MGVAVVGETRGGLHDKVIIGVITTTLHVLIVRRLKVHYQGTTWARPRIRAAAVERLAVMKTYLTALQLYRDQGRVPLLQHCVDDRERSALPLDFQLVGP